MKITLHLMLAVLLLAASSPCPAMISVENVSRERAKALGIELRAKPNGPKEAWIELELKPDGPMKGFQHVSLEISDGEQFLLGWTPLKDERLGSGNVVARVMGNRVFLQKVTLRVVCGAMGDVGHDLRIKDFVDLDKLQ